MRKLLFFILLAGLSILLVGCGGSKATETIPAQAPVTITLTTNPASPVSGNVELLFSVVDDKGQPVTGADFDVIADHTDMSGMTMHGKATEQEGGVYAIMTNFDMAGNWKLTVQVKKDDLNYKQDIELKIE
jgi:predicted component of type VI protein secretion system